MNGDDEPSGSREPEEGRAFPASSHRHAAVALGYDSAGGDTAPRVLAKGYGQIADRIIERAQEAGLYVHQSPEMVSLLMQVDLDAHIPPALYQVVAELLAWIYGVEHAQTAQAAEGGGAPAGTSPVKPASA